MLDHLHLILTYSYLSGIFPLIFTSFLLILSISRMDSTISGVAVAVNPKTGTSESGVLSLVKFLYSLRKSLFKKIKRHQVI